MSKRGTVGALIGMANVGLVLSIAIPTFDSMRMSKAFENGETAVGRLLEQARWSAISSGRQSTRVDIEGDYLRVRAGAKADAPIVVSISSTEFAATFTGTNLPVQLDAAGRRLNVAPPTVTIVNPRISAARTFRVGPLGNVERASAAKTSDAPA
jgi:hypothetical protein